MRRLASALHAFALLACSTAPSTEPRDAGAAARVELGTGEVAFESIPESGATLELVHGPQGGYHLVVAIRVWELVPDRLSIVYEVERPGGELLARTPFVLDRARFVREGDHLARYGDLAILDIGGPEEVAAQSVVVRVTATAQDGSVARDERTVLVTDAM